MGHYETTYVRYYWGYKKHNTGEDKTAHWGDVIPNIDKLEDCTRDLLKDYKASGWEIKSVMPLTGSTYYGTGLTNQEGPFRWTWAGGYGYSSSCTVGMLILLQRWVETENVSTTEAASLAPA